MSKMCLISLVSIFVTINAYGASVVNIVKSFPYNSVCEGTPESYAVGEDLLITSTLSCWQKYIPIGRTRKTINFGPVFTQTWGADTMKQLLTSSLNFEFLKVEGLDALEVHYYLSINLKINNSKFEFIVQDEKSQTAGPFAIRLVVINDTIQFDTRYDQPGTILILSKDVAAKLG